MALPDMVVDKPVLIDRRTTLGLAGMFACAWLVTFLVQLKNVFLPR
jgi:hypothetical protein